MKKVLYVILALAFIYLALCVMGPSSVKVERSLKMNASADAIQMQISDYNKFAAWSPWQEKDPNMKMSIEGEAGKVGHKYSWEGNKDVGKGSMEIAMINADTLKEILIFDGKGASDVYFVFKADSGGTTNVSWMMDMKVPFFGRGMMMFFKGKMDQMLGGDFEKGLQKLKSVAEAPPIDGKMANYEVKEVNWDAEKIYFGTKSTNLSMEKATPFFMENFPKLWADVTKNKVTPATAPSCIIFKWDDATMSGDMAAVVGAGKDAAMKGWEKYTVPAGKILMLEYYGPYGSPMKGAYDALDNYLKEKNLTKSLVIEEYITDPGKEKDSTKWQTNIYYTLK